MTQHTQGAAFVPTPKNLELAKTIVLAGWQARAKERNAALPVDASGSCKFASLFFQALFGGEIQGNCQHQYNVLNGAVYDLNENCADVRQHQQHMQVYAHDPEFFGNEEHQESMASCRPRVAQWVAQFQAVWPMQTQAAQLEWSAQDVTVQEVLTVVTGLHRALSKMIDTHNPDAPEAQWLSESNELVVKLTGCDMHGNRTGRS